MKESQNNLKDLRHSLAHLLAAATVDLFPEAKPTIGPAVDNGFYYDFDFGDTSVSEDDLPRIEKRMREILPSWHGFHRIEVTADQARQIFDHNPYKLELIDEIVAQDAPITLYYSGPAEQPPSAEEVIKTKQSDEAVGAEHAVELCRGGHAADLAATLDAEAFALDTLAGAYWRGDENNPMLTRIYGLAFGTKEELEGYLQQREEAKERDHRKLGQELDLFTFSELVGSGLPLFTRKGAVLRELLGKYSQQLRAVRGFDQVWTPHLAKNDLYKKSGHWDKFGDELFLVKSQETSDELVLKPMNCPHHTQIYASRQRSYRDLPIRYMENTTDYRDEKSGELHGLSRVRAISQDDSHVFCRPDQIEVEVAGLVRAAQEMYAELDMKLSFALSFKDDSDGYLGDASLWEDAQSTLERVATDNKLDYEVDEGEAAFYGPKIDFLATDGLGRKWQVATVQLDFVQPGRFDLEYTADDGSKRTPVMVHCALLGSIERFLSVYIEHTGGHFPLWLAPEQVRIIPVNDQVDDYIATVKDALSDVVLMKPLKYNELRYTVDASNVSLGKRIYAAEKAKIPVVLIAGPRDKKNNTVSLRINNEETTVSLDEIEEKITTFS